MNLAGVPQGVYSVRVTNGTGGSDTLPAAFTVTAAGQANLQTQLILPAVIGRHISSTFYVEYSNTGTAAMPAPVLLLESSVADDLPLFTLNKALVVSGFWTSALPQGYSTRSRSWPAARSRACSSRANRSPCRSITPACMQPWNLSESQFKFDIRIFNTTDTDPVELGSLQSALQPAGISNLAWSVVYGNLTAQLGNTWGGYVQLLDNEASYLGQLGEDVTDVNQLWGFAVQQADNALSPVGPSLASATDDSVAIPGSLSLSFSRVFAESIAGRDTIGAARLWLVHAVADDRDHRLRRHGDHHRGRRRPARLPARFADRGRVLLRARRHRHAHGPTATGGYLLTEADGTATDYNANGTLNYIQDTNGNRITAGYTSGRLTSLTASSGPVDHHRLQRRRADLHGHRLPGPRHHVHLRLVEPVPDLGDRIQRPDHQLYLQQPDPDRRLRHPELLWRPARRSRSPAARTSISPTTARADWPAHPTTAARSPSRSPTRWARSA